MNETETKAKADSEQAKSPRACSSEEHRKYSELETQSLGNGSLFFI